VAEGNTSGTLCPVSMGVFFVAGSAYVPESGHAACSSSRQPPSRGLQCRKRSCKRRPWRYQGVAAVLPVGSATFATSRTFEPSNACMALKRLCVGVRVELSMTGVGQWERAQQCSIAPAALAPMALLRRSGRASRRGSAARWRLEIDGSCARQHVARSMCMDGERRRRRRRARVSTVVV
jgi:hypothetical protein